MLNLWNSQTPQTIIMTSAMYTGTTFLRELLISIPHLVTTLTRDLANDKSGPFYLQDCTGKVWNSPQINLTDLNSYLTKLKRGNGKILFLEGHIHEHWMHSLVFFVTFNHKVISPIRHPFDSLLTKYLRQEPHILNTDPYDRHPGWLWSYLQILALQKNRPKDVVLVPVDLLGQKPEEERVTELVSLLASIGVKVSEKKNQEFYQLAREWKPTNTHTSQFQEEKRAVSDEVYQEITDRLEKSNVYYYLEQAGIHYPIKKRP
tara:strand:+ start:333 stop:1115 length:783 start_codon:yes stop_codon:yes gene_type:complete